MFQRTKLCTGLLVAFGGSMMLGALPAIGQTTADPASERVEVTGSRIKRVDAEGSLPVTVINRDQLAASGATSIADFARSLTFASSGNFRPQSGSSAQSFAGIDLRGLGTARTLVLLDGRRMAKAPNVGDSVDLNSIPMAAIERIEILTDGASAIYGSDAIGGVINFITRKDFDGAEVMVGATRPKNGGGDQDEASAVLGMTGEKGSVLIGISSTRRQMVFTSQRPWGTALGVSTYGNNYQLTSTGAITAVPGGCTDPNFYLLPNGRCSFNFNAVAADEAAVSNKSFFMRGDTKINNDWSFYMQGSASKVTSFGRYAPTPGAVLIAAGSPNNPTTGTGAEEDVYLYHRFASAGNRDTTTDNNIYDILGGVRGTIGQIDIDAGARYSQSKYTELGRNYIVGSLAAAAINDGSYDIFNPSLNPESVVKGISATIGRDSVWKQQEAYVNGSMPVFQMAGGAAAVSVGAEWRKEDYADIYDSLSESGSILGSAGNSAGGGRIVKSLYGELLLPVTKTIDFSVAARYEKYSDYGSDFSPKASANWKINDMIKVRGSVGRGFRAPSLPILTAKTAFSAEAVEDPATCLADGNDPADCASGAVEPQVNTFVQSNSQLKSEKSKQFSLGIVVDPTNWLSVKADYWNVKITDAISYISAQDIVNRSNGTDSTPIPAGLGLTRDPITGAITRVDNGYANEGTLKVSGLDLNATASYKLGAYGSLRHNLTWSHVFEKNVSGADVLGEVGEPKNRVTLSNGWTFGDFDFDWNVNMIGKNGSEATGDRVGTYVTNDLQANWNAPWKGKFTVGVLNAGDKFPSLVAYDGRNFNYYLYDSYGRQVYVRYTQKF